MSKPPILLQTDFRLSSGLVASMYGVIKQVESSLEIFDLHHNVPEYDTLAASALLRMTLPFWPAGTIFVSVVDPGVGTSRRACVAKTSGGSIIVTPDNGTLTYVKLLSGIDEVRVIDENANRYRGTEKSHTFHGRDLFAYTAARLAAGVITFEQVGPSYPTDEIIVHAVDLAKISPGCVEGAVSSVIPTFGNINTNIDTDGFEEAGFAYGDVCHISIRHGDSVLFDENVPYHRSFGYVKPGEPVLFNGSTGFMGLALNKESMLKKYFAGRPSDSCADWKVTIEHMRGTGDCHD